MRGNREGGVLEGKGKTHVEGAGEGVDDLVCADVVVDEDVLAVFGDGFGGGGARHCGGGRGWIGGLMEWRFDFG